VTLYDRLRETQTTAETPEAEGILDALRQRAHHWVVNELGSALFEAEIDDAELRARVPQLIQAALRRESVPLSAPDKIQLVQELTDDILGNGPIERYLSDPAVSEVMVNGPKQIYIEQDGKLQQAPGSFIDDTHLRRVIERIVAAVGRRIDESSPMVDARLPDGSRAGPT
jgi:pilus assembly protein CpaF